MLTCSWLCRLWQSEEYSDFTIACGAKIFKVHKAVICTQSNYFKAACKPEFQASRNNELVGLHAYQSSIQEGSTGTIKLKEDDETRVEAMIEFLYTQSYTNAEGKPDKQCGHDESHTHTFSDIECILWPFGLSIDMYVLADKYDIVSLRQYACSRLEYLLQRSPTSSSWEEEMSVLEHAYQHSRPDEGLRQVVINYIVSKTENNCCVAFEGITAAKNFYSIIRNMPDVSEALIRSLTSQEDDD